MRDARRGRRRWAWARRPGRTRPRPPCRGHRGRRGRAAGADTAPHANSRRMTGNRGSSMARTNPAASQKAGVAPLVASGRVPSSGYASTAANPRAARSSQTASTSRRPWPSPRALGDRRDAGDDGRQRRDGQTRVEIADALGSRVRGQRAELAVRHRPVALGAGPWRSCRPRRGRGRAGATCAAPSPGRPVRPWVAVRTDSRPARHRRRGTGSRWSLPAARERVADRAGGAEIVEERVARTARRRWLPAGAIRRDAASRGGPPWSLGRRPPSSRTTGGRSPDPHTAGRARRSGHP